MTALVTLFGLGCLAWGIYIGQAWPMVLGLGVMAAGALGSRLLDDNAGQQATKSAKEGGDEQPRSAQEMARIFRGLSDAEKKEALQLVGEVIDEMEHGGGDG